MKALSLVAFILVVSSFVSAQSPSLNQIVPNVLSEAMTSSYSFLSSSHTKESNIRSTGEAILSLALAKAATFNSWGESSGDFFDDEFSYFVDDAAPIFRLRDSIPALVEYEMARRKHQTSIDIAKIQIDDTRALIEAMPTSACISSKLVDIQDVEDRFGVSVWSAVPDAQNQFNFIWDQFYGTLDTLMQYVTQEINSATTAADLRAIVSSILCSGSF